MAEQPGAKIDVTMWIVGIVIIVGFMAALYSVNAKWEAAANKSKQAYTESGLKLEAAMDGLNSARGFVSAIKVKNAALYEEVVKTLPAKAQKDIGKLADATPTKAAPAAKPAAAK